VDEWAWEHFEMSNRRICGVVHACGDIKRCTEACGKNDKRHLGGLDGTLVYIG
jgi:hypothetical protein